jgi:small subunit ribosomal protein S6
LLATAGYKPQGDLMNARTTLYETIFVLHPELTEEEAEEAVQSLNKILEDRGSETIRIERGGKRRLAYPIRKQRYGYYNLIHFRALPNALLELERVYRLSDRVLRYISVRYDKEEQMTGFTRLPDDDGREDRRRMGRRADSYRGTLDDRRAAQDDEPTPDMKAEADKPTPDMKAEADKPTPDMKAEADEEPETPKVTAAGDEEPEASLKAAEDAVADDEEVEEATG